MAQRSRLRSGFPCEDLCWEGESVNKEKASEFLQLFDFGSAEFFIVMRALISIEPDEVRPVPQIRGELPIVCKLVDAFSQRFPGGRLVKFAGGHINGLAEHRCGGVGMSACGVIKTLNEWTLYRGRNVRWSVKRLLLWVLTDDRSATGFGQRIEVACAGVHHPLGRVRWMMKAHAEDFVATIAGKRGSASVVACRHNGHRAKGHSSHTAVWAVSNESYRHIHSMDAQERALRWES